MLIKNTKRMKIKATKHNIYGRRSCEDEEKKKQTHTARREEKLYRVCIRHNKKECYVKYTHIDIICSKGNV